MVKKRKPVKKAVKKVAKKTTTRRKVGRPKKAKSKR
jgi:hypothetical protein